MFEHHINESIGQGESATRRLFEKAQQEIMVQAPELDEMVQGSSVVAGDR